PGVPLLHDGPPPSCRRGRPGRGVGHRDGGAVHSVWGGRGRDALVRGAEPLQVRRDSRLQPDAAPQGSEARPDVRRLDGYHRRHDRRRDHAALTWDFSTEPDFERKLEWMRRFMHDEVYPLEVLDVDERAFMRAVRPLQEEVKRQKLWATHLPPELGGQGYGQVKLGLMHEIEGASVWGPIVFGNQAPDSGNSEILAHFGTDEQKQRWLRPLLDGKIRSAFSMTEPNTAGSDPTLLSTTAELKDGKWVINGHKWFTSNGMVADFLIVMVVTEPKADPYERASMIIVPADTPGVQRVRNIPTLAGEHERFGYGHAEVVYENVRVPAENVLGERGQGFLIAQMRLGPGRIHHCMRWLGQARRAFDMLCERALQREAFGKKL